MAEVEPSLAGGTKTAAVLLGVVGWKILVMVDVGGDELMSGSLELALIARGFLFNFFSDFSTEGKIGKGEGEKEFNSGFFKFFLVGHREYLCGSYRSEVGSGKGFQYPIV